MCGKARLLKKFYWPPIRDESYIIALCLILKVETNPRGVLAKAKEITYSILSVVTHARAVRYGNHPRKAMITSIPYVQHESSWLLSLVSRHSYLLDVLATLPACYAWPVSELRIRHTGYSRSAGASSPDIRMAAALGPTQ